MVDRYGKEIVWLRPDHDPSDQAGCLVCEALFPAGAAQRTHPPECPSCGRTYVVTPVVSSADLAFVRQKLMDECVINDPLASCPCLDA